MDPAVEAPMVNEVKIDPKVAKETAEKAASTDTEKLPPLSAGDFRIYNNMAERMNAFHNHFRATWKTLYKACEDGHRPQRVSLSQFIGQGIQFCQHLTAHHDIEETYIFPQLAKKMPPFKKGTKENGLMIQQHKQIHAGLDLMHEYLQECRDGDTEFRLDELKQKMDLFGEVLWTHLDAEVVQLGAENMRLYWTTTEMRQLAF